MLVDVVDELLEWVAKYAAMSGIEPTVAIVACTDSTKFDHLLGNGFLGNSW